MRCALAVYTSGMVSKVRAAVIGTGSLGKEHARLYSDLARGGAVDFAGVYDSSRETALRISEKLGVRCFESISDAAAQCDAASIVTPTSTHYEIARGLLQSGKHVLVEKPM